MADKTYTQPENNSSKIAKSIALVTTALLLVLANTSILRSFSPRLEMVASGPEYTQTTLFLDNGKGFNEAQSLLNQYKFEEQKTRLVFPVPLERPQSIRFDPIQKPKPTKQAITIHQISLKFHLFGPSYNIPLHNLVPHLDVAQLTTNKSVSYEIKEESPDPQLLLNVPSNWKELTKNSFSQAVYKQLLLSGLLLSVTILTQRFILSLKNSK